MNIEIKKATESEWEDAMELAWRTFLQFEAPYYKKEGCENFLKFVSSEDMFKMFQIGEYLLYVAVCGEKILGMGTMRGKGHISLLFIDKDYHKKGIGTKILRALQKEAEDRDGSVTLTVNSSPYGYEFYKRIGFIPSDSEKEEDGIIYTPMTYVKRI